MRLQMASPIPVPPYSFLPWSRLNTPKIVSASRMSIPIPLSRMLITHSPEFLISASICTSGRAEPAYLIALPTMFYSN